MSDEDKFLEDDVTGETEEEAGEKGGFLSNVFVTVLKWAAIGLAIILLVVTITWATIELVFKNRYTPSGIGEFSPEYKEIGINLSFFKNELKSIRGQTSDMPPKSFLASVSIGYESGNNKIMTELIDKTEIIQNLILKYFGSKQSSELITKKFNVLEEDIKSLMNKGIMQTGQVRKVLIHELQVF